MSSSSWPTRRSVDLTLPPKERWREVAADRDVALALQRYYLEDLGVDRSTLNMVVAAAQSVLQKTYLEEMVGLAEALETPLAEVIASNLYYDAIKAAFACTAFAVDGPEGPLHARNLDWWTEGDLLTVATQVTTFTGAPAGDFVTIGWPGFVGVLSGIAPGRFAVTLNAVVSDDPPQIALPGVFLVRQALEMAETFEDAMALLAETPLASDALLLLTGVENGQAVVVERTPKRYALRWAEAGAVWVTNDYRKLSAVDEDSNTLAGLQESSCRRFDRIGELLERAPSIAPSLLEECLEYLSDQAVKMGITVQQMAFSARSGDYRVKKP